jgi:hypothetical protein
VEAFDATTKLKEASVTNRESGMNEIRDRLLTDRVRALEGRPHGLDRLGRLERRVRYLEVTAAFFIGFLIGRTANNNP